MKIVNSKFENNKAIQSGGVMYLKDVEVYIVDSEFLDNKASKGGVVYADI